MNFHLVFVCVLQTHSCFIHSYREREFDNHHQLPWVFFYVMNDEHILYQVMMISIPFFIIHSFISTSNDCVVFFYIIHDYDDLCVCVCCCCYQQLSRKKNWNSWRIEFFNEKIFLALSIDGMQQWAMSMHQLMMTTKRYREWKKDASTGLYAC